MNIKGFTYGYHAIKGLYDSVEGRYSQDALMDTGANWVCLAFPVNQKTYASTEILFDYRKNVPDLELLTTIKRFHDRGVRVCLKPMINSDDGVWRALIDFPDQTMMEEDIYWAKWFASYQAFLTHYAALAQYAGCEMFCLGCEMLGTERKEEYWRQTIAMVREIYDGPLVYNTNHGKEEVAKWYDAIDYIGTSAYYPVESAPGGSLAEMQENWGRIADKLAAVSGHLGKKIIFMEIGCRSALGCARMPWDFVHKELPVSQEEQARFYESCLSVMSGQKWFEGVFWWDWGTRIYHTREEAERDTGFNIYLKKAEDVVKKWYRG
ncbi:MAG: glycosyl hydrolase family 53 [Acetatifactor sp.]|nr:glycosyl hydrolase family 53 [Acetatifactor sp.]